jgi:hypothetical protein
MIYLLIASTCAENYPPASICNMVLKTQFFFSKVERLSKSSSRHMRKIVQPSAGEYGAKQETNHLPANRQMAANDPGLMVSQKLFTQNKKPQGLFREHSLQRTESPQFPETPNFFMFFILASNFQYSVLCFKFFFSHMF